MRALSAPVLYETTAENIPSHHSYYYYENVNVKPMGDIVHDIAMEYPEDWKLPSDVSVVASNVDLKENRMLKYFDYAIVTRDHINEHGEFFYDPPLRFAESVTIFCKNTGKIILEKFLSLSLEEQNEVEHDFYSPTSCDCSECSWIQIKKTKLINERSIDVPYPAEELLKAFGLSPINVKDGAEPFLFNYNDSIIQNKDYITLFSNIDKTKIKKHKKAYLRWKVHKKLINNEYLATARHELLKDSELLTSVFPVRCHRPKTHLDITNVDKFQTKYENYKWKLENTPDATRNLTSFVLREFKNYTNSISGKKTMVLGWDTARDKWVGFEVFNRFSPQYAKKFIEKFKPLNEEELAHLPGGVLDLTKSVLLTLTCDKDRVGTVEDAWEHISKDFNIFITHLKHVVKDKIPKLEYITVPEAQENGYPHIHVVFFGIDWLLLNGTYDEYVKLKSRNNGEPTIESIWKKGFTWVNKTSENKTVRQPLSYIFKFIKSNWSGRPDSKVDKIKKKATLTRSYLWFFNKHCFNISLELGHWLKEHEIITDIDGNKHHTIDIIWIGIIVYDKTSLEIKTVEDLLRAYFESDYG